jgi:hypothetical protein
MPRFQEPMLWSTFWRFYHILAKILVVLYVPTYTILWWLVLQQFNFLVIIASVFELWEVFIHCTHQKVITHNIFFTFQCLFFQEAIHALRLALSTWLPNFSRHNIPKRGKLYHMPTTLLNGHKIYQLVVKYS